MARTDKVSRLTLAGVLAIVGVGLSGCSLADLPRYGMPDPVTPQGRDMQYFWSAAFTASLVVGAIVWGAMFWSFIVYRKKAGSPLYPKQTKENLPFELVCTAIPFVLIAVLFYFNVVVENRVLAKDAKADVVVDVTAFKWNWDFGYRGTSVPGTQPNTGQDKDWYNTTEVHTIGTATEIPVLVVPADKVVEFHLQARDVVHSFWVPDFMFKRDVFPYPKENSSDNVFQVTIDRQGAFVGRCAELCGTFHSQMNFEVRAVPQNVFDAYIAARSTVNPQSNKPYTASEALTKVGQEIPSCGQLCSPTATTTYPFETKRDLKSESKPGGN